MECPTLDLILKVVRGQGLEISEASLDQVSVGT